MWASYRCKKLVSADLLIFILHIVQPLVDRVSNLLSLLVSIIRSKMTLRMAKFETSIKSQTFFHFGEGVCNQS